MVERLPTGYAQVLGERAASLSDGERQLLSFARAVAANPALLVLDEATSAADSEAEAAIQSGLAVLMEGWTTIAVAHRLSTILEATEILVLHHGQIVERGTHRSLLERGVCRSGSTACKSGNSPSRRHGKAPSSESCLPPRGERPSFCKSFGM